MVYLKNVNNADTGTADKVGGNQWDSLDDLFANIDNGLTAKINSFLYFRSGKMGLRNVADTFQLNFVLPTLAATKNINYPALTADDEPLFKTFAATILNKILDSSCDASAAVPDGSTTVKGKVELATSGEVAANVVVQGNDSRLSDSRAPNGTATGDLTGSYPAPTIAANAVTNAKAADMAANTIKANATAGSTDPADLAVAASTVVGRGAAGNIVAAAIETSQIAADAVTFAKMVNIATDKLIGRDTAASGDPEEIGVSGGLEFTTTGGIQTSAFTGDVTKPAGSVAQTIANLAVTYAKIQNITATSRILGRITAGAGSIEELTPTQLTTLLDVFTTGLKGLVPASGGGSTNFLRADGVFAAPPGAGGGEANTSSNVGTGAGLLAKAKVGVDLPFKSIKAGSNITVTNNADDVEIAASGGAGGDSVSVNGTSATDADFDDTTPAAPTDTVNVKWQKDAGTPNNISAYLDVNTVTKKILADIATDRLLGRDTALTGDPEEITVGGGIEFTGSGGIQSSAYTGDVTKAAGGTAQTIANDAVTYAKMQNISATDRLLGRDTAAAGDTEELTVTGGLEFTGTGGIQRSALTGDVTATAGSNATTIPNNTVTNAKMADMAANTARVNNTGSSGDPVDMSVGASTVVGRGAAGNIVAAALETSQIAADAVTYAKLQNISATDRLLGRDTALAGDAEELTVGGGIEFTGSGGIQSSAYTGDVTKAAGGTAQTIANDAVTYAKLQNISATDRLLGRDTAAAGDAEELTVGGGVEFTGSGGIQRSALTGDVTATAGSNTTAIGAGVIVDADINASGITTRSKLPSAIAYEDEANTFTGAQVVNALLNIGQNLQLTGVISPTQIVANTNDYAPTNLATSTVLRLSTDASRNITGLTGGAEGRVIIIQNVGSFNIVLTNQDAASSAGNRFLIGYNLTVKPDKCLILVYDNTLTKWRPVANTALDAETCGSATGAANGSTTVFNIAHGLGSTPSSSFVIVSSVLGSTIDFSYTFDSTNIVVTFASAPLTGTITFQWRAVS